MPNHLFFLASGHNSTTLHPTASAIALRIRYEELLPWTTLETAEREKPALRPISALLVPLKIILALILLEFSFNMLNIIIHNFLRVNYYFAHLAFNENV